MSAKRHYIFERTEVPYDGTVILRCRCGWNSRRMPAKEAQDSFAQHQLDKEHEVSK